MLGQIWQHLKQLTRFRQSRSKEFAPSRGPAATHDVESPEPSACQSDAAETLTREHRNPSSSSDYGFLTLADGSHPIADIIAIHGLDGHRLHSFTDLTTNECWLSTLLPKSCPRVRVATYGYNAATQGDESLLSSQSMFNHGNDLIRKLVHWRKRSNTDPLRQIIFIAHSLGGLILKHALIIANDGHDGHVPDDYAIKSATYGLIFLGTPHHGVQLNDVKLFLSSILTLRAAAAHPVLVDLERPSRHLLQQVEEYNAISQDFETKLVYENRMSSRDPGGNSRLFVSQHFGNVGDVNVVETAMFSKDHLGLARFSSNVDPDYIKLVSWIETMIKNCREEMVYMKQTVV